MTPSSPPTDEGPVWARDAARKAARRNEPSFKRLIVNLIAVAAVAAVVAFLAAPVVAFFGIRAAAEAGDVAGLARLIDYDAVRASLRPQLSGRPEPLTPPPSFIQDPIGAVRRQFDLAVTNDGGARTVFTFERRGPYEWKLVHVGLPEATSAQP